MTHEGDGRDRFRDPYDTTCFPWSKDDDTSYIRYYLIIFSFVFVTTKVVHLYPTFLLLFTTMFSHDLPL